ncbi:MAG TPA: kynureninase [Steroidobacter sp.]
MKALTLADIRALDASDPLREYRERFDLPGGVVYLDGHSLGPLPHATRSRLSKLVDEEWARDLIQSWAIHDWIGAPARVGDLIAQLIGAEAGEVIVSDSTTVNLHKLIHAALAMRPGRSVIVSEHGNFPTDLYAIEGVMRVRGGRHSLRLASSDRLIDSICDNTALVLLTHVNYKASAIHDMRALTEAAHARGALILWDLSHSAGALEVDLNRAGADFAVGCGYKYLNGGPGAPAFLFIARRHHEDAPSLLSGWMGHEDPFDFREDYVPAAGIRRFLCGTPSVPGVAALEEGVKLLLEAGLRRLAAKSRALSELFITLLEQRCADRDLVFLGPRDSSQRGSHVAVAHPNGFPIMQALIESKVIGDFRAPDVMRFGLAPLYTRYEDVWIAVQTLAHVTDKEVWNEDRYGVRGVTT